MSKVATDINNGDPVPALAAVPLTTGDFLLNTSRLRPRLSLADTLKSDEKKEKTNKIVLIVLFSMISIRFQRLQYAIVIIFEDLIFLDQKELLSRGINC